MKREYFLTTERLGFSRWRETDLPLATALWGDEQVTRLIRAGGYPQEEIAARLRQEMDNEARYGLQYWPVFELGDHAFAGCCGFRPFEQEEGVFEMGFHLLPRVWGLGYASEAGAAALEYALRQSGVRGIVAGHHPDNAASGRVLEKLGFRFIGENYYAPTGRMHPSYRYGELPGGGGNDV